MNLSLVLRSSALAALLAVALSAHADIDQSQPVGTMVFADKTSSEFAQSFKQTHDNITGAGFLLALGVNIYGPTTGATSVTIGLFDALPSAGGTLLASGTVGFVSSGSYADVSFGGTVPIVPEQTYYLVLVGMQGSNPAIGGSFDVYGRGNLYEAGTSFTLYDSAFRTTYAPVPEPATLAALGLGAVGLLRKRRR